VLITDICLSCLSFTFCYILFWGYFKKIDLTEQLPILILINIILKGGTFYVFKTYNGVVRFAGEKDAYRIILANVSSMSALIILNKIAFDEVFGFKTATSVFIFDFLASTFSLVGYRIMLRLIYDKSQSLLISNSPTLIFGAGQSGYITKRAIQKDRFTKYKIVAFLDDNPALNKKLLDGIPIYLTDKYLDKLVKDYNIRQVIIAVQTLSEKRKKQFIEKCLSLNVKVLQVPSVQNWINDELSINKLKDIKLEDLLGRDPITIDTVAISRQLKNKNVLITGAAGSIGSEIARQVASFDPKHLILVDEAESPLVEINLELQETYNDQKISAIVADITDRLRMSKIFSDYKPEILFHAAAYKHVPIMELNPYEAVKVNVFGTINLVDLAVENSVEKFVMISTDKAVNPTNVMGASKRLAEIYAQAMDRRQLGEKFRTRFVTTRFGNVLGSNGSVIPRFRKQIESGKPVTVTHPDITRYFMTIPEACRLVLEAGVKGKGGEIFLFDMGEKVRIVELAEKMIRLAGKKPYEEIDIVFTGLRPGEKLTEELLNDSEKTIPTHHEKIMIAKVAEYDMDEVQDKIMEMRKAHRNQEVLKMVAIMKELIPEYISNNSIFSILDKKSAIVDLSGEGI